MLVVGVILLLAGAGSLIYGITQNNSASAQWNSFLSSGSTNPGTVLIVIGVIGIVLGLLLIIFGGMSEVQNKGSGNTNSNNSSGTGSDLNGWVCPNCAQLNSMLFNTCSCGTPRPVSKNAPASQQWVCTNCSSINPINVKICKCGRPITSGIKINPNQNTAASSSEWLCPSCGRINANYVGTCGCGQTKP